MAVSPFLSLNFSNGIETLGLGALGVLRAGALAAEAAIERPSGSAAAHKQSVTAIVARAFLIAET